MASLGPRAHARASGSTDRKTPSLLPIGQCRGGRGGAGEGPPRAARAARASGSTGDGCGHPGPSPRMRANGAQSAGTMPPPGEPPNEDHRPALRRHRPAPDRAHRHRRGPPRPRRGRVHQALPEALGAALPRRADRRGPDRRRAGDAEDPPARLVQALRRRGQRHRARALGRRRQGCGRAGLQAPRRQGPRQGARLQRLDPAEAHRRPPGGLRRRREVDDGAARELLHGQAGHQLPLEHEDARSPTSTTASASRRPITAPWTRGRSASAAWRT